MDVPKIQPFTPVRTDISYFVSWIRPLYNNHEKLQKRKNSYMKSAIVTTIFWWKEIYLRKLSPLFKMFSSSNIWNCKFEIGISTRKFFSKIKNLTTFFFCLLGGKGSQFGPLLLSPSVDKETFLFKLIFWGVGVFYSVILVFKIKHHP